MEKTTRGKASKVKILCRGKREKTKQRGEEERVSSLIEGERLSHRDETKKDFSDAYGWNTS